MEIGFNAYEIPLIGIVNGENEYFCIADSGSDSNILTQKIMTECSEEYTHHTEIKGSSNGFFGDFETTFADVSFKLFSLFKKTKESDTETIIIKDASTFQIISDVDFLIDPHNEKIPQISGVLGSPYMLKRKWVLDFNIGRIYSEEDFTK